MPKWEVKQPLDYSATGDDIDSASQKLIATLEDVYEKLNRLRTMDADALHSAADPMPFTWKIDTSIDPPAILIRNADNTDYIQIGSVTENMGITASDMGAITGDGMKKLSLGAEQDLPAAAETNDMYFAYDTARLYIFRTGSWRKFLSLRFEDLLGVGDAVIERSEVALNGVNKIPRLNEVGQGAFDITGSAAKIGDKNLFLPEIPDGSVLVFNATRDRWEVAKRDDITKDDVSTTGESNKIVKADANGAIANDTKGNAAKIATKTIDVSNLQDGDVLVYDATYGTFRNKQGAVVNAQGVVEANVSGSAAKWGGKTIQTVNIVDGQILVWSESNQAFINRNQGTVGTGRALVISQDYEEKANYNGDNYRVVNIITPHLRVASQEYAVGTTCFSKNMPNTTYLECVTAGVTAATEPDMSSAAIGDVVADGGVEWKICGYANTEVTDALRADVTAIETEIASDQRKPSTTYAENDIRYNSGLPIGWYLECTTAGITDSGDITLPSPVVENATVTDGTVVWTIRKIGSGGDGFAVGDIIMIAGNNTIRDGWLLCDGRAVSRTMFPDLFSAIGTTYGAGDGSTTFNLPNYSDGKFPEGSTVAGVVKQAGLPNITGGATAYEFTGQSDPTILPEYFADNGKSVYFSSISSAGISTSGKTLGTNKNSDVTLSAALNIDASRSSAIYGASDTVQPYSLTTRFIIKAYDGVTPTPAEADISEMLTELTGKANINGSNMTYHKDVITTSGTYTVPATGLYKITIKGGGGGGGAGIGYGGNVTGGGGGGEGGTTTAFVHMTAGDSTTVIVGAGGTGGTSNNGGTGGDTSVTYQNNTLVGSGGEGGTSNSAGKGGTGTLAGSSGGSSHALYYTSTLSTLGGSGGGTGGGISRYGAAGDNGTFGGGGGGGGATTNTTQIKNGGAGGDGYVWFEYYTP